jgi:prepilin-type processing-associated H-X9-DG protein
LSASSSPTSTTPPSSEGAEHLPTVIDTWGVTKKLSSSVDDSTAGAISAFNHVPGGANVLFMDGHVEFLKYTPNGGEFPVITYDSRYGEKVQRLVLAHREGSAG